MAVVSMHDIHMQFGQQPLLEGLELHVEAGERVCIVGRNGVGKSTLLKIMAGEHVPDAGTVTFEGGVRVTYLPQEVPVHIRGTVQEVVAGGQAALVALLDEYNDLSARVAQDSSLLKRLEILQHELDVQGGWELERRAQDMVRKLGIDGEAVFAELSAGLKRRTLLGRALISEPQLLLLDEPTNHLEIEAITLMEEMLLASRAAMVFVSHDRVFLDRLATRIVEIERGQVTSWNMGYAAYREQRAAQVEAEMRQEDEFDKKLAREEVWVRKGIKARRTRNEGRVRLLEEMREQRRQRRSRTGQAGFVVQEAERGGKLVLDADNISFAYGDTPVIEGFSTTVIRGDRVGIIGPNGVGKTTLVKLLLGELTPGAGRVRQGTRLKVAYFDQLRDQLDDELTVWENVADGNDTITVGGSNRHVMGYLNDFLFTREQALGPANRLSGGERNRLLLARLFTRPANVLVLDEPTNDLDAETLDLLEEKIMEYQGTVLVVSHDRAFLNNVVTSVIAFEPQGVFEYVGGYDEWLRQRRRPADEVREKKTPRERPRSPKKPGLSYKQQRELEALPETIEQLEQRQQELYARLGDPAFYQEQPDEVAGTRSRLEALEDELAAAYARWEELEELSLETNAGSMS